MYRYKFEYEYDRAFVSKFVVVGYLKKSPVLASIFNLVQGSFPRLTVEILQVDHGKVLHLSLFVFPLFLWEYLMCLLVHIRMLGVCHL